MTVKDLYELLDKRKDWSFTVWTVGGEVELAYASRKKFRVLSAWIDTFENDIKSTVYHKCYVNANTQMVCHG